MGAPRRRRCAWVTSRWPSGWPAGRWTGPQNGPTPSTPAGAEHGAGLAGPRPGGRGGARRGGSGDADRGPGDGVGAAPGGQPVLDAVRTRAGDDVPAERPSARQPPSARITLDALSGTFAMNAGQVGRAVDIAGEVLAAPDAPDMAVAWAASAAALSSARMGRFAEVGPLVQRALGAEYPGLLRFTVGLAETTTLLMTGQDEAALETARRFTDFAELAQPGRAIGECCWRRCCSPAASRPAAAELMGPAAATLELTGYSWGPLSLMYLATALGQLGEVAASAMALSRAQSRHGTKSGLFTPNSGWPGPGGWPRSATATRPSRRRDAARRPSAPASSGWRCGPGIRPPGWVTRAPPKHCPSWPSRWTVRSPGRPSRRPGPARLADRAGADSPRVRPLCPPTTVPGHATGVARSRAQCIHRQTGDGRAGRVRRSGSAAACR